MKKARILYDNKLTATTTTVTASSATTALPARWKKWRSLTTTGDQRVSR